MNRPTWKILGSLALASLAACSSGSSSGGGGSLFVQSCSLGCGSGSDGSQVNCAIVNTFENQALSVIFSQAIDPLSLNNTSFQVVETLTGQVPDGTLLVDPVNPRRVIFRPAVTFDINGNVEFGFRQGASYQVFLPGTSQSDSGPFVRSVQGNDNQARLLCTLTTDQGVSDTVPGRPTASVFVDTIDLPSGVVTPDVPADGAVDVDTDTLVKIVFNDLMAIGSLVVPATGLSPSIGVLVDVDGDLSTPLDRVAVDGSFSFSLDSLALTTTLIFTPNGGLPGAGPNPLAPRKIVVDISPSALDIAGNAVDNAGIFAFTPVPVVLNPVTITENFSNSTNEDEDNSGSGMWSQDAPLAIGGRMLGKGLGGGSGRLGALNVQPGATVTLDTSPRSATGTLTFVEVPCSGETLQIDGRTITFSCSPMSANEILVDLDGAPMDADGDLSTELMAVRTAAQLNGLAWSQAVSFEAQGSQIVITAPPGSNGNDFVLSPTSPLVSGTSGCTLDNACQPIVIAADSAIAISDLTLIGGSDGSVFAGGSLLDNTDAGVTPSDILVDDGIFEFSSIRVGSNATLILRGENPARLFARGAFDLQNGATIDIAGANRDLHVGANPTGQAGGEAGPNGGSGGDGGDRINAGVDFLTVNPNPGFSNPGAVITGGTGGGVGGTALAAGTGGAALPATAPTSNANKGDWNGSIPPEGEFGFICYSIQVSSPGGGGAYSTNGSAGQAEAPVLVDIADPDNPVNVPYPLADNGNSNTAGAAAGGDADTLGIEPPEQPPVVRLLDPSAGNLRGGSGGGGGGTSMYGSGLFDFDGGAGMGSTAFDCATFGPFGVPAGDGGAGAGFNSHSAGGGGGAGGALQVHAGADLTVSGFINAAGGDGGRSDAIVLTNPLQTSLAGYGQAGGAGSGGAVLLQGSEVVLNSGAFRMDVSGGSGGTGLADSEGGDGGAGLVRVEDGTGVLDPADVAELVAPFPDPVDPVAFPNSESILSVGPAEFALETDLPRSLQGAQSCWFRPSSQAFALTFPTDDFANNMPAWDARVVVDFGAGPQEISYRNPADNGGIAALGGQSLQDFWGDLLNRDLTGGQSGAPIVFRLQGAKTATSVPDLCNVVGPQLQSTTPWVRHIEELNAFAPAPDLVRFVAILDESHPDAGRLIGVTSVILEVIPE